MVKLSAFWFKVFHEVAVKVSAVAAIISGLHWGGIHFQSHSHGCVGRHQVLAGCWLETLPHRPLLCPAHIMAAGILERGLEGVGVGLRLKSQSFTVT